MIPQIIHNLDNQVRKKQLLQQLRNQGIKDYSLVPALMLQDRITGCSESHKKIIRWALDNNMHQVMIFEDDVKFTSGRSWKFFNEIFDQVPENFDIFLGGSYFIQDLLPCLPNVMRIKKFSGTHCMIIKHTMYEYILSCPAGVNIDAWISANPGNYYLCYPMPVMQSAGYSDIKQCEMDYSCLIPQRWLYMG